MPMPQSHIDWSRFMEALQGKANIDVNNLSKVGKETVVNLVMPSSKFIDLSLPPNQSILTAPANGYYYLHKIAGTSDRYIEFINETTQLTSRSIGYTSQVSLKTWIMVKKGENIRIVYNATGETKYFRFIYAEGSKE